MKRSALAAAAIAPRAVTTRCRALVKLGLAIVLASCASYGPYHGNSASAPSNSIRGPADGRYKFAFIEFGDQGSELDPSQRAAALDVIRRAPRPFLLVPK